MKLAFVALAMLCCIMVVAGRPRRSLVRHPNRRALRPKLRMLNSPYGMNKRADNAEVDLVDRIVGGIESNRGSHPYIVSLKSKTDGQSTTPEYPDYPEGQSTDNPDGQSTTQYPEYTDYPEGQSPQYPDGQTTEDYPWYPEGQSTENYPWYPEYPDGQSTGQYPQYPDGQSTDQYPWYPQYPEGQSTDNYPQYPEGQFTTEQATDGQFTNGQFNSERANSIGSHFCGGALITPGWVLTAAHCVVGENENSFSVSIGEYELGANDGPHEKNYDVEKIISHKGYNENTMSNDIALIKLKAAVNLTTEAIKTIGIPTKDYGNTTEECVVIGWGVTAEGADDLPDKLREVNVSIIPRPKCNQYSMLKDDILSGMLCAGLEEGGKDSCQGDSGGPLVCTENGVKKIAGVVSWGYGCAVANQPGVYTNVYTYNNWIDNCTKTPTPSDC